MAVIFPRYKIEIMHKIGLGVGRVKNFGILCFILALPQWVHTEMQTSASAGGHLNWSTNHRRATVSLRTCVAVGARWCGCRG